MDRVCDEVLQLIFAELDNPADFAETSKRLYAFSQDPYLRASYFLSRYGRNQAMFWALGKGRLMNPKVIDILISSGAHLSRYLVQVAMHHYFRSQAQFVKGPWVRTLAFPDFSYFMLKAGEIYGDIPSAKGEDDGSVFTTFLKESRFSKEMRSVGWEDIREILEKYKFMPFAPKDPLMAQFPLALSVEPRLLPYAVANGFSMDHKYRDFVFRKMFEKRSAEIETHAEEIVRNVRELCRLDASVFVSRTVAAEVCMELKTNEPAYEALKQLDKGGNLLFDLSSVVDELIKLFANTRSITAPNIALICRALHADFPSQDPAVRLVLLLTILHSEKTKQYDKQVNPITAMKERLAELKLEPLSRDDIVIVLSNPFAERCGLLLDYALKEIGMEEASLEKLIKEVAFRSLEEPSKGKTLRHLSNSSKWLKTSIAKHVLTTRQLKIEDLPLPEDEKACREFQSKLSRELSLPVLPSVKSVRNDAAPLEETVPQHPQMAPVNAEDGHVEMLDGEDHFRDAAAGVALEIIDSNLERDGRADSHNLGVVSQNTLTSMIRKDEWSARSARRSWYSHALNMESLESKYPYPPGALEVGKWVCQTFGAQSAVTAVFLTHAVVNRNDSLIQHLLGQSHLAASGYVPVTLKHFKLLARLGRAPSWAMWAAIENGAEFYLSEDDYISADEFKEDSWESPRGMLVNTPVPRLIVPADASEFLRSGSKRRKVPIVVAHESSQAKRPRRSVTSPPKSYAETEASSEEDADLDSEMEIIRDVIKVVKETQKAIETSLQLWIKHLKLLQKEEQLKYNAKRKQVEKGAEEGCKARVPKSEFFKSLCSQLRELQNLEIRRRASSFHVTSEESCSEGEDAEYRESPRSKRRKISR